MDIEWMAEQYHLGRRAFSFECLCGNVSTVTKHAVVGVDYVCDVCGRRFRLTPVAPDATLNNFTRGWIAALETVEKSILEELSLEDHDNVIYIMGGLIEAAKRSSLPGM